MKRSAPTLAGLLSGLAMILTSTAALAAEAQPKSSTPDGVASTATQSGLVWIAKQIPFTSDGNDLGGDIALFGDIAMIGSDNILGSVPGGGAVYVYDKSGSNWIEQQKLEPSQPVASGFFGTAIAVRGETAVIGQTNFSGSGLSRETDEQPNAAGGPAAAYVFELQAGAWVEAARFEAPQSDPSNSNSDRFAMAVAVDGGTVAVGASRHAVDPNLPEQGAVYVYADDGAGWHQVQKLIASDGRGGDHFGSAITVQGNTMLIGARDATRDRRYPTQGAVYVFERIAGVWTETQRILAPSVESSLQFGNSLAIDGETALVGAPRLGEPLNFPRGNLGGMVFVLTRQNNWWTVNQQLMPSLQPRTYDAFGFRVALSGDLAVSGAWQAFFTDGLVQQGVAHVYERVNDRWTRATKLTAPDGFDYGNFGRGVALSGRSLLATGKGGSGVMYGFDAHLPATASITPESLRITVGLQGTTQAALRIENPGDETLNLTLDGATARPLPLQTKATTRPQPWPVATTAVTGAALNFALDDGNPESIIDFTNVLSMLWLGNEQAAVWLNRFAAPTGTGAFTLDSLSILLPPQQIGTLAGKQINLVAYYDADSDGNPANATRLGDDHFVTVTAGNQFETFTTDFRVPGDGDIYVGYESSYARGGNHPALIPIATDTSAPVFARSWYATTMAPQLLDLHDLSANTANGFLEDTSLGGNWLIRATGSAAANDCIAPAALAWLHVNPALISVPAGGSTTITVSIDAASLAHGTHTAQLCVASNDPSRAMQRVSVTLTVLPEGTIFSDGFEVAP